ncbi:MAG: hypothetical protein GWP42_13865 [Verrucomicrobiales bacterium]|nr:hypothetical protein [Verrucomicrobiales bacterium]
MKYPLNLRCKIIAISPQIFVTESDGNPVLYVKQKLLKLKEHVEVFTDKTREKKLCDIKANKVIDWSSAYNFTGAQGNSFGGIRRKGLKSLWKARYEIYSGDSDGTTEFNVSEKSVLTRVIDGIFGGIPIIGLLAGYVAHPAYIVTDGSGKAVMRLRKKPALWEGKFSIESLSELSPTQQTRILAGLLMMVILEKNRS